MFDKEDPSILWVSPDNTDGDGTFEKPFGSINHALDKVKPGGTIVLTEGVYGTDITVQISGTQERPIWITGDHDAQVEIHDSCWFFYDTSDLIITNLTFKNAPFGALSIIGECSRNRFDSIHFLNCGTSQKSSCTMFFGGAGGNCNVVENCVFENSTAAQNIDNITTGLMISEGDTEIDAPLKDHIVRRNRFIRYGYGIILGTNEVSKNLHGHIIEYNTIENCTRSGIQINGGDIQVRGNLLHRCSQNSISVQAGIGAIIDSNRIVDCCNGVVINDAGHSIKNNCIIRCKEDALRICNAATSGKVTATNVFIEKNTFINCGNNDSSARISGITIDPGTTFIIGHNLVFGEGKPYRFTGETNESKEHKKNSYVFSNNLAAGGCEILNGFTTGNVEFFNEALDNYRNESEYGANGWVLTPEIFDPHIDETEGESDYLHHIIGENPDDELDEEPDQDHDYVNEFFYPDNPTVADSDEE